MVGSSLLHALYASLWWCAHDATHLVGELAELRLALGLAVLAVARLLVRRVAVAVLEVERAAVAEARLILGNLGVLHLKCILHKQDHASCDHHLLRPAETEQAVPADVWWRANSSFITIQADSNKVIAGWRRNTTVRWCSTCSFRAMLTTSLSGGL